MGMLLAKKFILVIIIVVLALIAISQLQIQNFKLVTKLDNKSNVVNSVKVISKEKGSELKRFEVSVADTADKRMLGLMFVKELPENKGMYFIFNNDNNSGFWMKNCEISLDIIYINSANEIVDIIENAQPCRIANCEVYTPITSYRYVLEINGGLSKKLNIKIGDSVESEALNL